MKDNFSGINVIPLVDIMLVLIVMVLMTATFIKRDNLQVNLPKASASSQTQTAKSLHLEMMLDGTIFVDGQRIEEDELAAFLADKNREDDILISADSALTLQPFIGLLDCL